MYSRVSNIPKPKAPAPEKKEAGKKGKKGKKPRNINIDNIKFEGNTGMNLEDLIKFDGGDEDYYEEEETTDTNQ